MRREFGVHRVLRVADVRVREEHREVLLQFRNGGCGLEEEAGAAVAVRSGRSATSARARVFLLPKRTPKRRERGSASASGASRPGATI